MSIGSTDSALGVGELSQIDSRPSIVIVLATWNGSAYLQDQLDSIVVQTYTNWRLIVGDDGSTDATMNIVQEFASRYPGRVITPEVEPVCSAKNNFLRLLQRVPEGSYVALCDQDDVWAPQKLEVLVDHCSLLEKPDSGSRPVLVYSDLTVVDEALNTMGDSFMRSLRVMPSKVTFASLLVENHIPGCSMLINRSLVETLQNGMGDTQDIIMHDWWLALLAQAFGKVEYVDQALVSYRQHASNTLGAVQRHGIRFALGKIIHSRGDGLNAAIVQGQLFKKMYGNALDREHAEVLNVFCSLKNQTKYARVRACLRSGLLKQTWSRRIFQLLFV